MADQAYAVMDVDGVITHLSAAVRSFSEDRRLQGAPRSHLLGFGSVMGDLARQPWAAATACSLPPC